MQLSTHNARLCACAYLPVCFIISTNYPPHIWVPALPCFPLHPHTPQDPVQALIFLLIFEISAASRPSHIFVPRQEVKESFLATKKRHVLFSY